MQQLGHPEDARHRRAQLVAHRREEPGLRRGGRLGRVARLAQPLLVALPLGDVVPGDQHRILVVEADRRQRHLDRHVGAVERARGPHQALAALRACLRDGRREHLRGGGPRLLRRREVLEPASEQRVAPRGPQQRRRGVVAVDQPVAVEQQVRLARALEQRPEALLGLPHPGDVAHDAGVEQLALVGDLADGELQLHRAAVPSADAHAPGAAVGVEPRLRASPALQRGSGAGWILVGEQCREPAPDRVACRHAEDRLGRAVVLAHHPLRVDGDDAVGRGVDDVAQPALLGRRLAFGACPLAQRARGQTGVQQQRAQRHQHDQCRRHELALPAREHRRPGHPHLDDDREVGGRVEVRHPGACVAWAILERAGLALGEERREDRMRRAARRRSRVARGEQGAVVAVQRVVQVGVARDELQVSDEAVGADDRDHPRPAGEPPGRARQRDPAGRRVLGCLLRPGRGSASGLRHADVDPVVVGRDAREVEGRQVRPDTPALGGRDDAPVGVDHRDLPQQRLLARQRLEQRLERGPARCPAAAQRVVHLVEQALGLQQRAVDLLREDPRHGQQPCLGGRLDRAAQLQRVHRGGRDHHERAGEARGADQRLEPGERPAVERRAHGHCSTTIGSSLNAFAAAIRRPSRLMAATKRSTRASQASSPGATAYA